MFKKLFVSGVVATALTLSSLGGVALAEGPKSDGKRQDAGHRCTSGKSADHRQDAKGDRAAKRQNDENRCKAKAKKSKAKQAQKRAAQAEKRQAARKA